MKEKLPYDDKLKHLLNQYESDVSGNLFDRILDARENTEIPTDNLVKQKLADYESDVPTELFENIIFERDSREPSLMDIVKNKLFDYESAVPESMFDRIIDARKRRRPVFGLWQNERFKVLIATLLIGLLFVSYNLWHKNAFDSKIAAPKSNDFKTEKQTISSTPDLKQGDDKASDDKLNKGNANIYQKNITIQPSSDKILNIEANVNNVNKTSVDYKLNKRSSKSTKITSNLSKPTFNPISSSIVPSQPDYNSEQLSTKLAKPISENTALYNPLNIIYPQFLDLKSLSEAKIDDALPCKRPDGCPTFGNKTGIKPIWYLDVYGAPEYAFRNLTASSIEYNEYRNARDTVESSQYAFSAGVRATAMFQNNFLLRGGIIYAQTNEKFVKDSFGIGNIRYIIDKNPTTGQLDTVQVEITNGFFRKTRYNHYRSLDFTIQGGYQFALMENLSIGINGGINFNLFSLQKATILAQDLQPLELSKNNSIYKTSVGTSVVGSLSAFWQPAYKWQLMIEPQFRYYLNPITKSDYALRQKYINVGLNIGVRYRL